MTGVMAMSVMVMANELHAVQLSCIRESKADVKPTAASRCWLFWIIQVAYSYAFWS